MKNYKIAFWVVLVLLILVWSGFARYYRNTQMILKA